MRLELVIAKGSSCNTHASYLSLLLCIVVPAPAEPSQQEAATSAPAAATTPAPVAAQQPQQAQQVRHALTLMRAVSCSLSGVMLCIHAGISHKVSTPNVCPVLLRNGQLAYPCQPLCVHALLTSVVALLSLRCDT